MNRAQFAINPAMAMVDVAQAEAALKKMRASIQEEAVAMYAKHSIGDRIEGKSSNGGIPCWFEIASICVSFQDLPSTISGYISYRGKRLNKDRSVGSVEAYAANSFVAVQK